MDMLFLGGGLDENVWETRQEFVTTEKCVQKEVFFIDFSSLILGLLA